MDSPKTEPTDRLMTDRPERAAGPARRSTAVSSPGRTNPFDVSKRERLIVLALVLGGLASLVILGFLFAPDHAQQLLVLVPSSFFLLGKFLPMLSLNDDVVLTAYELGVVIGIMDTCTCLLIVYSLELMSGWSWLRKAQDCASLTLTAYPWMRKFALTAIVLFVFFPVAGTGAVSGSFLGALLGVHRFKLIAAVATGGFLGGLGVAWATVRFGKAVGKFNNNPWFIAAVVLLLVVGIWAMNRAYKKALAQAQAERDAEQDADRE